MILEGLRDYRGVGVVVGVGVGGGLNPQTTPLLVRHWFQKWHFIGFVLKFKSRWLVKSFLISEMLLQLTLRVRFAPFVISPHEYDTYCVTGVL